MMRERFPPFNAAQLEWLNVLDGETFRTIEFNKLLRTHINEQEVMVEVHRKLGAVLFVDEVSDYIGLQIGKGEILIANRAFTSFVVVGVNGVATGWSNPA
jgi:hypothetical protein